jgi:hypothetical protein
MINYTNRNVLDKKVKKCLNFDPFLAKSGLKNEEFTNLFHGKYQKEKLELQKNYYTCSSNCFQMYENLPIMNYHYEISCECIKGCYDDLINKKS